MFPFRDLVKRDLTLYMEQKSKDAFQRSKQVIVDLVRKGIFTFGKD